MTQLTKPSAGALRAAARIIQANAAYRLSRKEAPQTAGDALAEMALIIDRETNTLAFKELLEAAKVARNDYTIDSRLWQAIAKCESGTGSE